MRRNRKAFTLIELLVVIAIIAILAAILFPVFAQAKLAAKKAADVSNVKQLVLAQITYSSDNNDKFPGNTIPLNMYAGDAWDNSSVYWGNDQTYGYWDLDGGHEFGWTPAQYAGAAIWTKALDPYVKNREIFATTTDDSPNGAGWAWTGDPGCGRDSYHMNAGLMGASQTQVPQVADFEMYRTHRTAHRLPFANPHFYNPAWCGTSWAEWTISDPNDGTDKPFDNGENIGWADGHAKFKKLGTLTWYEIGETDADPSIQLPPDGYWCMNQPWRGDPTTAWGANP